MIDNQCRRCGNGNVAIEGDDVDGFMPVCHTCSSEGYFTGFTIVADPDDTEGWSLVELVAIDEIYLATNLIIRETESDMPTLWRSGITPQRYAHLWKSIMWDSASNAFERNLNVLKLAENHYWSVVPEELMEQIEQDVLAAIEKGSN